MRSGVLSIVATLALACSPTAPPLAHGLPTPRISALSAPSPVVVGTALAVRGLDLDRVGSSAQLVVGSGGGAWMLDERVGADPGGARVFLASDAMVRALGDGMHAVELVLHGEALESEPFDASIMVASSLPLALDVAPSGSVHFEDVVVLHGAGFTTDTEGTVTAHVLADFAPTGGGAATPIDVRLPVALADLGARDRGVIVLPTSLAGPSLRTGVLHGTLALESTLASGQLRSAAPVPLDLAFIAPEIFALDPSVASIGEIVSVRGAGFLGEGGETTTLRIDATFTPEGGSASPFAMELVPTWTSGAEVGLVIDGRVDGTELVAALFGAQRGALTGTATAITLRGTDELDGAPTPFTLTLGAPRQVVELRFLPGWYDSLGRLGLAAAEEQVEGGIVARITSLYAGHAVDVRTSAVTDFADDGYAIVEIGGPDPNGAGLFGYDNAPGKDVGNLRLFDRIGGANAEQQADGFPGYGGVFVESMLWWSSHPELASARPSGAPPPDPLFDEVFDAVRAEPATYDEAMGIGGVSRVAAVARAIRALANLVGETTAHELGHSLGLAQPYGDATAFHDVGDGDGCLMDTGSARPLGERMGEPGFTPSHFCYDEPAYLTTILASE